jgi:choline kinase
VGALGEAVGINLVRAEDVERLKAGLRTCGPLDYFEKGIEYAIGDGLAIYECDVSEDPCIEIDFPADLEAARQVLPECLPRSRPG